MENVNARSSLTRARRARLVCALGVVAVAVTVAACGSRSASNAGATNVRIAIGGQKQFLYLPTTLAQELGYYKDEGLDVELQDFPGGAKALQALVGGSADVVSGFYDHTIQMQAEGREMIAFVTMLRYPGLVLAVAPQATDVKDVADLKGKIAGVTAAGSSTQMLLTQMLHKKGVPPEAVGITAIGTAATAIAAIEHGTVAAGMMAEPAFTMVVRRSPGVRILVDLRTGEGVKQAFGADTYPGAVLYSTGDWIRGNRDTTASLARAVQRTLQWMHAHSAEEISAKAPADFKGGDEALYVEALEHSMPMYSPDGRMAPDGAESVLRVLAQSMDKVRDATIDLSKTFTNEFLK